jgi:hypothetical protein
MIEVLPSSCPHNKDAEDWQCRFLSGKHKHTQTSQSDIQSSAPSTRFPSQLENVGGGSCSLLPIYGNQQATAMAGKKRHERSLAAIHS